jgi:AraC family transcriptional regulator of arabinose operon
MSRIHVAVQALRWRENTGLIVDRPTGFDSYVLLHFRSAMEIRTEEGVIQAEPGCCLLFSPDYPQWYRGREGHWSNDWMHLEGEEVGRIAERHGITLNAPLAPKDTQFFPHFFEKIAHERQYAQSDWEEAVDLLVRQMFLLLGRALHDPLEDLTPTEAEHLRSLRALRWRVHQQLTRRWTVSEMGAEVGLSASRFAALYQQFFEVSPLEDLLRARLRHAQNLLTNRTVSVREAAKQSGFTSLTYFSHVFRHRVGCAPRDYRRGTTAE